MVSHYGSYYKVYLLPDYTRQDTKPVLASANPCYSETLSFQVSNFLLLLLSENFFVEHTPDNLFSIRLMRMRMWVIRH